ncbi:hypothetical protein [Reinekea sp.]|uniref:hypothetical protein n=1 Tax=Reinekea sp. TaxID=1970455 RepID=UPI003989A612
MNYNDLLKWTSVIATLAKKPALFGGIAILGLTVALNPSFANDSVVIETLAIDGELLELDDLEDLGLEADPDQADEESQLPVPDIPEAALPAIFKIDADAQSSTEYSTAESNETATDPNVKVNLVEINEFYYLLEYDEGSGTYLRSLTQEAKPGDLIEIEIIATNLSDEIVEEVEMVNTIPTGPVSFIPDSVKLDSKRGFYRISSTGQTFFSPETEIAAADINFIKWQIFALGISDTLTLSYQIKISP